MVPGFTPIKLEDYVERHLRANPDERRTDVVRSLQKAMDAHRRGVRCGCGAPIWIVGSSVAGLACFTCITGESQPDNDFEIAME